MMHKQLSKWLVLGLGLPIILLLSACGSRTDLKLAPISQLRADIQQQPDFIQEAYRLALANPEVLSQIPCYCGCRAIHRNVKDCFVREVNPDGTVVWDTMGLGCKVCQDTVFDTHRLTRAGKSLAEIRTYVDWTYSRFGPSTDTPPVRP